MIRYRIAKWLRALANKLSPEDYKVVEVSRELYRAYEIGDSYQDRSSVVLGTVIDGALVEQNKYVLLLRAKHD